MKEILGYIIAGALVLFLLWMLLAEITGQKYKKKLFGIRRIPGGTGEVPLGGNVFGAYYVLREGERFGYNKRRLMQRTIAAFFLKWVLEGKAVVRSAGGVLRSASLDLILEEGFTDRTEMALFEMALAASGRDYSLTTGEFRRWISNYYRIVDNWGDRARIRGRRYLISRGLLGEDNRGVPSGYERLRDAIRFKQFVKNPTQALKRNDPHPERWTGYLVMGALYGNAGKVADALRRCYPSEFSQFSARQAQVGGSLDTAISVCCALAQAYVRVADRENAREERRSR